MKISKGLLILKTLQHSKLFDLSSNEWREQVIEMIKETIDDENNTGWKEWKFRNILPIFIVFAISVSLITVTGCISKLDGTKNNETQTTPITTTTPITNYVTPFIEHTEIVSPAPKQLYIKAGQFEQFTYRGHNITVNYTSAHPTQIVKVTFDGTEKIIKKNLTDKPDGIYWRERNLTFNLLPVVWEIRDGQRGPSYETTWNTSELYFVVSW